MEQGVIQKASQVQDAITDCVNNLKYLGKCVDELVDGALAEETGDIKQAAKWLGERKKVRRKAWGATFYCYKDNIYSGCLLLGAKYCEERYWSPSVCDLLADDWVVVK